MMMRPLEEEDYQKVMSELTEVLKQPILYQNLTCLIHFVREFIEMTIKIVLRNIYLKLYHSGIA